MKLNYTSLKISFLCFLGIPSAFANQQSEVDVSRYNFLGFVEFGGEWWAEMTRTDGVLDDGGNFSPSATTSPLRYNWESARYSDRFLVLNALWTLGFFEQNFRASEIFYTENFIGLQRFYRMITPASQHTAESFELPAIQYPGESPTDQPSWLYYGHFPFVYDARTENWYYLFAEGNEIKALLFGPQGWEAASFPFGD